MCRSSVKIYQMLNGMNILEVCSTHVLLSFTNVTLVNDDSPNHDRGVDDLNQPILFEEVREAIRKFKIGKAIGVDGILADMILKLLVVLQYIF